VATVAWTTDQVVRKLFPDTWASEWSDASGTVDLVERMLPPSGRAGSSPSWMKASASG
jgi:hypothetical protein